MLEFAKHGRTLIWESLSSVGAEAHRPLRGRGLTLARLVWVLVVLVTLTLFVAAVPGRFYQLLGEAVDLRGALQQLGLTPQFLALYSILPELEVMFVFLIVGAVLFWRRSEDWVALFMSLTLVMLGILFTPTIDALLTRRLLWRAVIGLRSLSILLSILFLYFFPDGRFIPRWTKPLALLWVSGWLLTLFVPLSFFTTDTFGLVIFFVYLIGYTTGVVAQLYRYLRRAGPQQQAQTKWVVWGSVAAVLSALVTLPLNTTLQALFSSGVVGLLYTLIGMPMLTYLSPLVVLLALGISVWRYRLWDLDVLINRGLVYGTLTALLGGLYFFMVFLLTLVVRSVFSWGNETVVIFVATISIAFTFNPLRQRVQVLIDRAFYPSKINFQQLLPSLSARIATSIVPERLDTLLTRELPRQLQIDQASLLVLNSEGTCLKPVDEALEVCTLPLDHPLLSYLEEVAEPISTLRPPFDLPTEALAFLQRQGDLLCIPLLLGERLVGIYNLGPRASGLAYSREETRMFALLGQQAAVSVENARLYQQVQTYSHTLEQQVEARTRALEVANRDLQAQHDQLDIILQNMVDGLVVTDLEGQIELLNPVFEAIVGRPAEALVGSSLADAWDGDLLVQTLEAALAAPGTVVSADSTRDKQVFQVSTCTLGKGTDSITGVVIVVRDITSRVRAIQMKQEFISMVSHELRTPMTSVLGFSKLIKRQFERNIEPHISSDNATATQAAQRIRENLQIIETEGERLTRLIADVLDVSRMESGRMQWEMGALDLTEVIDVSVAMMRSQAQEAGLTLTYTTDGVLLPIYGDMDRLIQVVTNLLSNALKFTDEGGVEVRAWLVEPGKVIPPLYVRQRDANTHLPADEPCVAVSVTDSGSGIAEADLPEVFEKFRQVGNRAGGTRRAGTGLGLSICKEIITHHGGQIWAESRLGTGSRFVFTLPVVNERAEAA
ncbi:MAG: ATP-binding protein [Anaerolineales bacterium]